MYIYVYFIYVNICVYWLSLLLCYFNVYYMFFFQFIDSTLSFTFVNLSALRSVKAHGPSWVSKKNGEQPEGFAMSFEFLPFVEDPLTKNCFQKPEGALYTFFLGGDVNDLDCNRFTLVRISFAFFLDNISIFPCAVAGSETQRANHVRSQISKDS